MKHSPSLVLLGALLLAGCALAATPRAMPANSAPEPRTLTVFAAASLTDAFTEIGRNFEAANPGTTVTLNFAGSQALRTQIEEGAPADVFASANSKEMDTLVTDGAVDASVPQMFLTNRLVVILPADNPAGIDKLEDLTTSGVKLVLAAQEVPVGNYSRRALDLMAGKFGVDFKEQVLTNVVSSEDNVKQVVTKVQLGEADAGIVYTSDAFAAPELQQIEIPDDVNIIATYPIAPLLKAANTDLAKAFIDYVLSPNGQAVLQKWGFTPPQ